MKNTPTITGPPRLFHWVPALLIVLAGVPAVLWTANESLYASLNSDDIDTQSRAFYTLARIKTQRSDHALLAYLEKASAQPYQAPGNTLHMTKENIQAGMLLYTIKELAQRKVRGAIGPLLAMIDREQNATLLGACVCALSMYGDTRFYNSIAVFAKSPHEEVRKKAAYALNFIDNPDAGDTVLFIATHDPSEAVRRVAMTSLATARDVRVIAPLIESIKNETDNYRRSYLMLSLAVFANNESITALTQFTHSPDADTRDAAIKALKRAKTARDSMTNATPRKQANRCAFVV